MALILVGQTELWDEKLSCKPYTAVRQRIDIYCTLPHLDRAETENISCRIFRMPEAA